MNKCKSLNEARENIERIDRHIVKLIGERRHYVKEATNFKENTEDVLDKARVELIIKKVRRLAEKAEVNPDMIEEVYRMMITAFGKLEIEDFKLKHMQQSEDK